MDASANPLLPLHNQAGAELQDYDQIEIVSTFGLPQAEYAAVRKSVGLIDLPQRGVLEITGKDRHGFLNNLISNQVFDKSTKTPLQPGRWINALLLNLKGRVVLDMNVIELGDRTLLEMDVRLVGSLAKLLDRYLFAEQVKLTPRVGELHEIALHGPRVWEVLGNELASSAATAEALATAQPPLTDVSASLVSSPSGGGLRRGPEEAPSTGDPTESTSAPGLAPSLPSPGSTALTAGEGGGVKDVGVAQLLGPNACMATRIIGIDVVLWRDDVCGVPGVHIIVPSTSAAALWSHLNVRYGAEIELGKRLLRPIGWAAFNTCRIEAGRPLFGIDFELAEPSVPGAKAQAAEAADQSAPKPLGVLPAETGLLDRAVSFTKGCYLGQEVVARMHARGQVARKLVGLKIENDALPFAGELVYDDQQNQVGVITSSTMSPVLSDAAIALALVKKPHFDTGRTLNVPAEGAMRKAVVTALPFVTSES